MGTVQWSMLHLTVLSTHYPPLHRDIRVGRREPFLPVNPHRDPTGLGGPRAGPLGVEHDVVPDLDFEQPRDVVDGAMGNPMGENDLVSSGKKI